MLNGDAGRSSCAGGTFSRISGLLCYDWRVKKLSRTGQTGAWVQALNLSGVAAIAIHTKGPQGAVSSGTAPLFEGSDFEEEKSLALRRRGGTGINRSGGMW